MSDINEVRERLGRAIASAPGPLSERDIRALLADHARLRARVVYLEAAQPKLQQAEALVAGKLQWQQVP